MNAWFPLLKARTALLFAAALVLAGSVPVLYFAALLVWQFSSAFQAGPWVPLPATLLFTDHSLLQAGRAAPVLAFIPQFPWAWLMDPAAALPKVVAGILSSLHVGLVFALIGLAVMALGVLSALRQRAVIRVQKQWHEDRVRRLRDYRCEDGQADAPDDRREPFIGSSGIARNTDRRVA